MTPWTAILPFNFGRPCKTRLSAVLSESERNVLAMAMARHVAAILGGTPSVAAVHLLSPVDPALPGTCWVADQGRGLNQELAAARAAIGHSPTLFIHADLPLLTAHDVEALLGAAPTSGAAIAPDSTDAGTNALALADNHVLVPAFGVESCAKHRAMLPDAALVRTPGLAHDLDDPDDLAAVVARGFVMPCAAQ